MSGEAGRFEVGASYPGIGAAAVQATCDVAGFALTGLPDARYVEDLTLGDVVTNAAARVRNPCAIALTGVTAEAVGMPATPFWMRNPLSSKYLIQVSELWYSL